MSKELTPLEALNLFRELDIYPEELETIEKSLKALDLFIKKLPCKSLIELTKSHIEYNKSMPFIKNRLTQEEYDLLKEVLL